MIPNGFILLSPISLPILSSWNSWNAVSIAGRHDLRRLECIPSAARLAHTNSRGRVEYSEYVHEPQHHSDDHYTLNIDLMRPAWDEAIHQKQQKYDDDQRY